MAKSRQAVPVTLTGRQRERLEHLWFIYGNHGPKTTPGNHQFIQGLIEHGLDLRPLQTKRTAKREIPTEECVTAVEAILSSTGADEKSDTRFGALRLVPSTGVKREKPVPDSALKKILDELCRPSTDRTSGGLDSDGKDAA